MPHLYKNQDKNIIGEQDWCRLWRRYAAQIFADFSSEKRIIYHSAIENFIKAHVVPEITELSTAPIAKENQKT